MDQEYGLLDTDEAPPGDEWEEIDYTDTEADRIARERDRESVTCDTVSLRLTTVQRLLGKHHSCAM